MRNLLNKQLEVAVKSTFLAIHFLFPLHPSGPQDRVDPKAYLKVVPNAKIKNHNYFSLSSLC